MICDDVEFLEDKHLFCGKVRGIRAEISHGDQTDSVLVDGSQQTADEYLARCSSGKCKQRTPAFDK